MLRTRLRALALGALVSAAAPAGALAQDQGAPADPPPAGEAAPAPENPGALERARTRFVRAFASGTANRMVAAFAPGARATSNQSTVQPHVFADLAVALNARNPTWTQRELTAVSSTRVSERGEYRFHAGGRYFQGTYTITWIFIEGDWRIQDLRMTDR